MFKSSTIRWAALALILEASTGARAAIVSWTDWTSKGASIVSGSLDVNGTPVDVTFSGVYSFAQVSGGTNYWSPPGPYLSAAVGNAPPASDIIELSVGGRVTVTFSKPVVDPLIALVSWNSNVVDFGQTIEVLSYGHGYWGSGTPVLNAAGTGFYGSGEVHGVIRLPGTVSSFSFTHTSENWHGLTIGVTSLPVPEPASGALLALGLAGLGVAARRRGR